MKHYILIGFSIFLFACQQGDTSDSGSIKIGYLGPLTGDAASYGMDTLNGVRLAVEDINKDGGIKGRKVELIVEDGRCTGTDAASAARKLIHVDKVIAIIGGQCSGETLGAAPIADEAKIIMISPISSSPDVADAGDYIFRNYPSDALKTSAMATYFKKQGYAKVAIISENTDFAMAFRSALKGNLEDGSVVFDETVEPKTKDFRTLVTRLKDVDFDVFFPNAQSDAVMASMVQQLRQQKLNQKIVSHDVGDSVTLAQIAPDAVEGMQVINVPAFGEGGDFEQRFREKFGNAQATIAFGAHAYDAAGVLFEAIRAVGTDSSRIRDFWYQMDEYEGIIGSFSFDRYGDVVGIPYVLKEFQNGEIVTVADIALD